MHRKHTHARPDNSRSDLFANIQYTTFNYGSSNLISDFSEFLLYFRFFTVIPHPIVEMYFRFPKALTVSLAHFTLPSNHQFVPWMLNSRHVE